MDTTTMDIFNRIEAMYEVHWNHLMVFVTIAVAFGAIIVPIVVPLIMSWFQKKRFKRDVEVFEEKIKVIEASIEKKSNEFNNALKERTDFIIYYTTGISFSFEGMAQEKDQNFSNAIVAYSISATGFLNSNKLENAPNLILKIKQLLGFLNSGNFKTNSVNNNLGALIKDLLNEKYKDRFKSDAEEIKKLWDEAKARPAPKGAALN